MKYDPCRKPVPEVVCNLPRGHEGLCATAGEASMIAKIDDQYAELDRLTAALSASEAARKEAERQRDAAEKDAQILDDAALKFAQERNETRAALAAAEARVRELETRLGRVTP